MKSLLAKRTFYFSLWFAMSLCLFVMTPKRLLAEDTAAYFEESCKACHTIGGGRLVGPDLKGVASRQDRAWLVSFIVDPEGVIEGGDEYAVKLSEEYDGMVMPSLDVPKETAEALIDYISAQSGAATPPNLPQGPVVLPFTKQDIHRGKDLFTGARPFKNGGPACISCHSVKDPAKHSGGYLWLGGGNLGPDLTRIFERLKGRKSMTAWLSSPGTNIMKAIFKDFPLEADEIDGLVAYFDKAAELGGKNKREGRLYFFLFGLGGAVFGIFLFDFIWRNRFRSARRELVENNRLAARR